ncbi:hypothetical protein HID58_061122 [Brassica napus]|uniref:MGS-like domain-containing protein n=1 Tax=Brassica napus TaxID=3708 RepID=A0ABQ7ZXP9_BRANA|nr:hypothetical protein HID58_061122 [Brassica napus]
MSESQTALKNQPQSWVSSGKKQALISLSDKKDLATFGKGLQELGYVSVLISIHYGGTASTLENVVVSVTKVETLTHFSEIETYLSFCFCFFFSKKQLDGRVKTLHPNIHGGILARRDVEHHMEALNEHGIGEFGHLISLLFSKDGIENIDIGGPTMIRAAAKMSSSLSIQRIIKLFWSISKEVRTTNNSAGNLRGRPFSTLLLTIPLSQNGYGSRLREVRAYFLCDPPYTRSRCSGGSRKYYERGRIN